MQDQDFFNDIKSNSHLFHEPNESAYSNCPKCNSIFTEENICQTCGFNSKYNKLGDPLGERSFYTIRERYWNQLSPLERENTTLFKDEMKFNKYIYKVQLRYNDLLDYFYDESALEDKLRPLYLQEIKDCIIELMKGGIAEKDVWQPVNLYDGENLSLYSKIKDAIEEHNSSIANLSTIRATFGGGISFKKVIYTSAILILIFSFSLAFYSYYNITY